MSALAAPPDSSYIRPTHSYVDPTSASFSDHPMSNDPTSLQLQTVLSLPPTLLPLTSPTLTADITKGVIRKKLAKMRHLCVTNAVLPSYLDTLMPDILRLFRPQVVNYNGGVANIKEWKISCYLEVMDGGVPCTNPHLPLLDLCTPLLHACDAMFIDWYKQQRELMRRSPPVHTLRVVHTSCVVHTSSVAVLTPASLAQTRATSPASLAATLRTP